HCGRAADKCHVSQPTLSVALKKVEGRIGALLFERSSADVRLTPLGEQVAAPVHHLRRHGVHGGEHEVAAGHGGLDHQKAVEEAGGHPTALERRVEHGRRGEAQHGESWSIDRLALGRLELFGAHGQRGVLGRLCPPVQPAVELHELGKDPVLHGGPVRGATGARQELAELVEHGHGLRGLQQAGKDRRVAGPLVRPDEGGRFHGVQHVLDRLADVLLAGAGLADHEEVQGRKVPRVRVVAAGGEDRSQRQRRGHAVAAHGVRGGGDRPLGDGLERAWEGRVHGVRRGGEVDGRGVADRGRWWSEVEDGQGPTRRSRELLEARLLPARLDRAGVDGGGGQPVRAPVERGPHAAGVLGVVLG
ncbi:MAG: LysR family transcriptional regulator, partial [bacterium]